MSDDGVHGIDETGADGVRAESSAAGHELSDAAASPLAKVGIAMALLLFVAFTGVLLMFRFLTQVQPMYDVSPPPHPLRDLRTVSSAPRLQPDPPRQKAELKRIEDHVLTTYDWVDKEQGVVRIPIERAIELLAGLGLPEKAGTGVTDGNAATP